jgi:hypothetical protein
MFNFELWKNQHIISKRDSLSERSQMFRLHQVNNHP